MNDSKQRFTDRVEQYVKYRPGYPEEAIAYLYGAVGFRTTSVIADIGAGTGIFSQLLLERGSHVYVVEPNEAMRAAAQTYLQPYDQAVFVAGAAEQTGLADQSVDHIICAQSFHWFDRQPTLAEFRRVLRPGGNVALIWNSRDEQGTPFMMAYESLVRKYGTDYAEVSHKHEEQRKLETFFQPDTMQIARFSFEQQFDMNGLKGRLESSSYTPHIGHPNYEPMMEAVEKLFAAHEQNGRVSFMYETELYWGRV